MSASRPPDSCRRATGLATLLAVCVALAALAPIGAVGALEAASDHLVISEIVSGGASASDELVELYNPTGAPLPLEGLEVVYVSASGSTVTRRAAWPAGAPTVPPGAHVLLANELGVYASIADVLFSGGMAATGGSVAVRIQGADTAVDAVGWGTAASAWVEGTPAPAPAAGESIERLPGGSAGSTQDSDDNAADFVQRTLPDPQNAGSPPVPDPVATPLPSPTVTPPPTATPGPTSPPSPTPDPTSSPSPSVAPTPSTQPTPTPAPSDTPSPSATPGPISVAAARGTADGSTVTVEGVSLTGSAFTDGGGYLADASAGIAILVADGAFDGGRRLRITGTVDDRFSQRTVRASAAGIVDLGPADDPEPLPRTTAAIGEEVEGRLVRITGKIVGSPTTLTGGLAYDVDDGTGTVRVVVGTATSIDTTGWSSGRAVDLVGVAGQRDSTGTGTSGYRVMPRGPSDVVSLTDGPPSPLPSASPSSTASATPTPDPSETPIGLISIAEARAADKNARVRVRGVVTLGSGLLEGSAVIQDASGAILLRLSDEAGTVEGGELLDASGTRSTKSGMESIRLSVPPTRLGHAGDPEPRAVRTGQASESDEAVLVVARGAVIATPRRASSGSRSFDIDDGTGPLRVVIAGALGDAIEGPEAGAWVEVRGVLGQETTGAQPLRGYRIWPRTAEDLRIMAPAADDPTLSSGDAGEGSDSGASGVAGGGRAIAGLHEADGGSTIGATLVAGPWPELEVGGLLWDGRTLAALASAAAELLPDSAAVVPRHLELRGLRSIGTHPRLDVPVHALDPAPGATLAGGGVPHAPATELPATGEAPRWVSLVGRLEGGDAGPRLHVGGRALAVDYLCGQGRPPGAGSVRVIGIGMAAPAGLVVPCGGIRPAPLLAAATGRSTSAEEPLSPSPLDGPAGAAVTTAPERGLAAGLLATGSLGMLAAAWWTYRLRDPEGAAGIEGEPDVPTADHEPDATTAIREGGPRLTLVPLPHDRSSP
ncbi:MAG TPA: lamin tail domain-containing protein [Candidatus Limnocylindria bacterium]|nr:lamin tail domain-containing protein [Candidatus Limnocylindria bacterium]